MGAHLQHVQYRAAFAAPTVAPCLPQTAATILVQPRGRVQGEGEQCSLIEQALACCSDSSGGVQNTSAVPVTCHMELLRQVTLTSDTWSRATPYNVTQTVWRSTEGPLPPRGYQDQPCYATVRLPVDTADVPSVDGHIVRCRYRLRVRVVPADGCCAEAAKTETALEVVSVRNSRDDWQMVEPPADWKPQVLPSQARPCSARVSVHTGSGRASKPGLPCLTQPDSACGSEPRAP